MAIQKDISLRGCGEGALGSDEWGLLGALPRSWLLHWVWGACAGSLMELVYILVADVLAATGHAAPLLEPWSCVLHPWPLEGPSLQHVRSEPGKGSLYGWAPRPCLLPVLLAPPADCYLSKFRLLRVFRSADAPAQSGVCLPAWGKLL